MIDSLNATPSTVLPGGTVTIAVAAHDPDCATPPCTSGCGQYIRADLSGWSADGGTILSETEDASASPWSSTAVWEAPATEGTYVLTIQLADSGSFLCGGRLSTTGTLPIQVTTVVGAPPVIDSLTAEPAQLLPGETSTLTCSASDPDGDPIGYTWFAEGGTLVPGVDGGATFTAEVAGLYPITCTATDSLGLEGADSVDVSVTTGLSEGSVTAGLLAPLRVAVDPAGELYVVDRGAGKLSVLDLHTGKAIYRLPLAGLTSVAVDWAGRLLVGGREGARVVDRLGETVLELAGDAAIGPAADVAVDRSSRRFLVLHTALGRVAVYDETGSPMLAFGATGDGAAELRGPRGLAVAPDGSIVVADTGHGRIQVYSSSGALLRSFGGPGGGAGEFVRLEDVEVAGDGSVFASDSYQDWVQVFDASGVARDTLGTYGTGPGQLKTASGLAISDQYARLVVASSNGSRLEVFRTGEPSPAPPVASPAVAPSSLGFAPLAVGSTSSPQTVTLSNVGGSRLGIAGITVDGEFTRSTDCGPVLDLGESCSIEVSFRPTAAGERTGTLLVETSGEPMRVGVALAGEGFSAASDVRLEPDHLDFAIQAVGTVSDPQRVRLSNVGSATLTLSGVTATGDFTYVSGCPAQLPAGAGCPIDVRYAPSVVADPDVGALLVASDAAGSPHAVILTGRSTAAMPGISIAGWEGDEGGPGESSEARFAITLSRPTSVPVSVAWSTGGGTATPDEDYEAAAGEALFEPGETELEIPVVLLGDDLLEPDEEWFRVTLDSASGGEISVASADGVLRDDELCLGQNLLSNPSGEARPGGSGELPGWFAFGSPWRRQGAPPLPVDGDYTIYSASSAYGELVQDVDVSAFAESIDAGTQWFRFETWVRTVYEVTPTARVIVEYRDLDNLAPLDIADSGPILSPTAWTRLEDERPAPAGTGWIRVRLINLAPGVAYFDALALRSLRAASLVAGDVEIDEGDSGFRQAIFPVRLACPYYEPLALDYATRDGSAREGEDYLASVGRVELPVGETEAGVTVDVVGDLADEAHETFALDLALVPGSAAVLVDGTAEGRIRNDDFCGRTPGGWLSAASWPVDWLEIGGVEYGIRALFELLAYQGPDGSHLLASELTATKLNLARGTKNDIAPAVAEADAFLDRYPPGSSPKGKDKQRGDELETLLSEYNRRGCV